MARSSSQPRKRARGRIETLPSGSLRVKVYAGTDPVSGKKHYLLQTVPAGPKAAATAEKMRTRLLAQVDERRAPRTRATVNQLMDRYLELLDVEPTTRDSYEGNIRNHIRPLLGHLDVGRLDGEVIDSFYARLRRCREHCDGRRRSDHECHALANGTIRKIHGILNDSCRRAVRWRWLGTNPVAEADAPPATRSDPTPPTAEQAARIAAEAWKHPAWGMFVWLALVTGARRGELCALRWEDVDLTAGILTIRRSVAQTGARTWVKDTKTHQRRRISLDQQTVALLSAYRDNAEKEIAQLGERLGPQAHIFSSDPDGARPLRPSSVTQRYRRMCARLDWTMHLHELRHYSATELIAAGVDVRTVAGRLGHSGGGSTTLRVYSAWRPEADHRAANTVADRLPSPQVDSSSAEAPALRLVQANEDQAKPYRKIAADLRAAIACGALRSGYTIPSIVDLADRYGVAPSTAHRAIAELTAEGAVVVSRGKRASVV